jgi:hypothetical protein
LLWDERRLEAPTVEDHRKLRREAEEILGPEESLFRIDWVSSVPPCVPHGLIQRHGACSSQNRK